MKQAPYYILPDIEALKEEKDPEALRLHRRRIAANIGDTDALRAILGDSSEDFHDFYGSGALPQLSTDDTIDSFLERFGKDSGGAATMAEMLPQSEEPAVPVTPAMDYASILERQPYALLPDGPSTDDATMGAIDSFLDKTPQRIRPKKEAKEEEKPSLTMSFAKILIKNGNYRRALEIITEISLKNPEKSVYFADQIRFLQKLVFIESQKSKN